MDYLQALRRASVAGDEPRNVAGLYMLTLKPDCTLPGVVAAHHDILYVGKATNLRKRNHLTQRTSACTVRRSLAAMLPALDLVPQASGRLQAANWDLEKSSDERLSDWMRANLTITCIEVPMKQGLSTDQRRHLLEAKERELIAQTLAPLNLRDWPSGTVNPMRSRIEAARAHFTDRIRATHGALLRERAAARAAAAVALATSRIS